MNEYLLLGAAARFEQVGPMPDNFHFLPLQNPEGTFATYLEMQRVVNAHGVDLVHVPHTFWRPLLTRAPYVITVHDLLDYMYRARTNNSMRRAFHSYMTKRVMDKAARIFAVSNFTKRDVARHFNVDAGKNRSGLQRARRELSARPLHADRAGDGPRTLSGGLAFPALCRTHQPAQERGAHHRGLLRAEGGAGQRTAPIRI